MAAAQKRKIFLYYTLRLKEYIAFFATR